MHQYNYTMVWLSELRVGFCFSGNAMAAKYFWKRGSY